MCDQASHQSGGNRLLNVENIQIVNQLADIDLGTNSLHIHSCLSVHVLTLYLTVNVGTGKAGERRDD